MNEHTEIRCEICQKAITIELNDPSSYISKSVEENVLFGKLITIKTMHQITNSQKDKEQHFNIVVLDQNGKYRAHADSYVQTISSDKSKSTFLGRIAVIGPGGAGKTRSIQEMANTLAKTRKYNWSEEKNIAGTMVVTPYSLSFPPNSMAVFNDNPGQSSLDLIRKSVAQAGAHYKGIMIYQDATAWNFRDVGLIQARTITEFIEEEITLPVAVITTKSDLVAQLSKSSILNHHAGLISDVIERTKDGFLIDFFNRVKNQPRQIELSLYKGAFYFTQLEQLLVNTIQTDLRSNPIKGMTQINLRYYIRSILMGFASLVINFIAESKLGEIYPELNAFDSNLVTALNYYRPTAYETESDWEVIHGAGKNEPIILKEILDETSIKSVIKTFSLATKDDHLNHINKLKEEMKVSPNPDVKWYLVDHVYTDTISDEGRSNLLRTYEKFISGIQNTNKVKAPDIGDLNLTEF